MKNLESKHTYQKNSHLRAPVETQKSARPLTPSELLKIGGGARPRGGNY